LIYFFDGTFNIDLHMHSIMSIYLYLVMSILTIIHSKAIKIIQTTSIMFNQLYIIVFKHKSIMLETILSESILCIKLNQTHTQ